MSESQTESTVPSLGAFTDYLQNVVGLSPASTAVYTSLVKGFIKKRGYPERATAEMLRVHFNELPLTRQSQFERAWALLREFAAAKQVEVPELSRGTTGPQYPDALLSCLPRLVYIIRSIIGVPVPKFLKLTIGCVRTTRGGDREILLPGRHGGMLPHVVTFGHYLDPVLMWGHPDGYGQPGQNPSLPLIPEAPGSTIAMTTRQLNRILRASKAIGNADIDLPLVFTGSK